MKQKLKLLLLSLWGWSKVNNPNQPQIQAFNKRHGYTTREMTWDYQFKGTFIHFLFDDKTVWPVFLFCTAGHIFIFYHFADFFALPLGWIILLISLLDIGVTLCILYAIKKWKGRKK
jgi:hypothetical protein